MKASRTIYEKCPFCGASEADILLQLDNRRSIATCNGCGLTRTSPEPEATYDEHSDYFEFHLANERQFRSYARPQIAFVRQYAPQGTLLDIGCGVGFLLDEARLQGYDVQGLELNAKAVAFCASKGLKVNNCSLASCGLSDNTFEVVVMSHVLEHIHDFNSLLREVSRILKPGGTLMLSQPYHRGWLPVLLRRHWYGWVPDDHIWHFTPETLSPVLARHGLMTSGVQINSMRHSFGLNMATLMFAPLLSRIAHIAGHGDQFYLAATKERSLST